VNIKIWNLIDGSVYQVIDDTCICIAFTSDSLFCTINDDLRINIEPFHKDINNLTKSLYRNSTKHAIKK
jgi:hypothetical protein